MPGANPGPAAYRRGGPLTVTDCNVMLGRLAPAHFPPVFGPGGDQPLDLDAVRRGFTALSAEIAGETGQPVAAPEDVAQGFLQIAVANMANAIKKISVQRGHDVTAYTLNCFGGAGGQHACLVADALGMTRIFLHPFAGVLSAYGMGLAEISAIREAQADCAPDDPVLSADIARLSGEATAEVAAQGVDTGDVRILSRAHLRYDGSHQTLDVPFGCASDMQAAFEAAHLARFGFIAPDRALRVEMLEVEALGRAGELPDETAPKAAPPKPKARTRAYFNAAWIDVPVYAREALGQGATIDGPAILTETTGTVVLEPGWAAQVDPRGNLILARTAKALRPKAEGTEADPVVLEVMGNLFMSVADQMGATLANTAWSVNIKERLDFSCAIFDAQGDLVANAPHVPVHLGSMSDSIRTVIRETAAR